MSHPATNLTKKEYLKIKEVEKLYKVIQEYDLREQAYKKLLEFYIKLKKSQ